MTEQWQGFADHAGTVLIALDGLTFFSSSKLQCPTCLKRETQSEGSGSPQTHYFHSAVTPVIVKPGSGHVLPLMPEFVEPQDGSEKQDCDRNAAKRWLQRQRQQQRFAPRSVTYLGDDLYACQPICQLVIDSDQYFVCVAKPQSHVALYTVVAELQHLGRLHQLTHKHWNGRHYEH